MKARGPERPGLSEDEDALLRAQQAFLRAQGAGGSGFDPSAPAAVARRGAPPPLISTKSGGKSQSAPPPPAEASGPQRGEVDGVWLKMIDLITAADLRSSLTLACINSSLVQL